MKQFYTHKSFFILFFAALFLQSIYGQVSTGYTFSGAAGSPTLLTATYTQHTSGTTDNATYSNIPIGFTFQFDCIDYTAVSICNDGWIAMGTTVSQSYTPISSGTSNNIIAALAADLQGLSTGSLRSKTAGTAPNRTFTVEWQHYEEFGGAGDYTFQIVLYETTNVIKCYYLTTTADAAATTYQVGLRGASSSDYNNRTKTANASWATASTAGAANTDVMNCGTTVARSPGGIHTWTPVSCSGTPAGGTAAASPTSVCASESTSLSITGGATGCGLTWQWQSSPDNFAWSNISGATSTTYNASPGSTTYYRRVTTCTASGFSGNSASVLVTVNSCIILGTSTASTVSYPYYGSWHDSRSQFIITASELTAAGICPNSTLNSLSFNASSKASTQAYTGFTIKIGNTTSSTFSSATWLTPAFTTVYNGNYTTAAGWNLHNFSSGYVWDGTSNLVIETCFNNTSFTSADPCYYTSTVGSTVCYNYADNSTGCTMSPSSTSTSRPNMKFNYTIGPSCSGTPTGGTAAASPSIICPGSSSALSVTGSTTGCGITWQWQSSSDNFTWGNISGATSFTYTPSPGSNTYYRCVTTCTNSGQSANSASTLVTVGDPAYATLPYSQMFEGPWTSYCGTRDVPDNSWKNTPSSGNQSWRRQDDGVAGGGWTSSTGVYTPGSSQGSYSACFNGYSLCSAEQGSLDLYLDLSPAGTKSLCFDYINDGSSDPDDILEVLLSTNGGSSFPTTLLSLGNVSSWTSQTVTVNSTSATCVIRFRATGDCGFSGENIGIDNLSIAVPGVPGCATYTSPANGATNISCGIDALLYWTEPPVTACNPATGYDVYFQAGVNPPTTLVSSNQSSLSYNPGTLLPSTTYYWKILPRNSAGAASCATVWSFTTGAAFYASQTAPNISDGFENCLDWTVVNGTETNKWQWGTATDNGGIKSIYISNDGGTSNTYSNVSTSTVHFYKDITFPAGMTSLLAFDWIGDAESCCDELSLYFCPTTVTPVAGTEMSAIYNIGNAYNSQTTWTSTGSISLPTCGGETKRLVFSWHNDGSTGNNPPAAIDNITVTSLARTGTTCTNPISITLPYSKTGESTQCMGDDYTSSSAGICSSFNYIDGEDKVYKAVIGTSGCLSITLTNAGSTNIGFAVYNGCPDAGGTSCVASYGGASGGSLSGDVNIPSAGTYYVVVDTWGSPTYVNYDISISSIGGNTSNDLPCNATTLTLGTAASGDNTCTGSGGEPGAASCWGTGALNTVWYKVTVPASQDVYVRTTAISLLNTQIAAYTTSDCSSSGAFTEVGCNDDAPACATVSYGHSELQMLNVATSGSTLYIRVDGFGDTKGTFSILAIDGNNGSPSWPAVPGQDCGPAPTSTNNVCGESSTVDNPGYLAFGNSCDFPSTSTCLASGEKSSVWYTININANGNLEFDIVPNDYGNPNPITGQVNTGYVSAGDESDYDFALWKYQSACDGNATNGVCCTEIAAGAAAVSCDYNGLGVTGLYSATDETAPAAYSSFNGAYETRVAVTNGETYLLAISNYANDYVSGYTLKFSATSPVSYTSSSNPVTWSAVSNTAWSQPGNWGGCSAPTCTLDAIVASGGAQPVINGNANVRDLTINTGATLTIAAGCTLTVCGNFTNNGTLSVSPTSTLLFNNGSTTQTINGSLTGGNKIGNLVINKTGGSVMLNAAIDIGGNFTTSNATSILNCQNYYVKLGGNFSTAGSATLINCPTIEFNGVIPQTYTNSSGTLTLTNVVMNNTSSGLTLNGGATSNMVIAGTLTLTSGVIYTATTPVLIMNAGSAVSGGSSSSFVDGPMQKIGNTAFVFPVGDATNRWMRIGISAPTAASTFQAQYFYTAYSNYTSMCGTPTPVLNNASAFEYWQLDRTAGTGNAAVTLYWENAAGSGINSCTGAPNTGDLVVARFTGTCWENKNTSGGSYSGSCSGTSAGSVTSDVISSFSPFTFASKSSAVNPLPVELLYFTGKNKDKENILEWKTAAEFNNDFFSLERSANGYEFEPLITVDGTGNSSSERSYRYVDEKPLDGKNYYRLKQTDFDGEVKYAANIVVLEWQPPAEFQLIPNPASTEIFIYSLNKKEENVKIEITDISGRAILHGKPFSVGGSGSALSIDISHFSEGVYFVAIHDLSGKPLSLKKFVKMK